MSKIVPKVILIVLAVIAVIFCMSYINQCSEISGNEQALKQVIAEYNDTLTVVRAGNRNLYRKVAAISDMNNELDKVIEGLDNTIFSKTNEIVRLKRAIGSGVGRIDSTVVIDSSCIGMVLTFGDTTDFYTVYIEVEVKEKPLFDYIIQPKPFRLITYLARDKQGIWTGYSVPQKEWADFITIDSMTVEIENDEFTEFYDRVDAFKFGVGFGFGTDFNNNETIINIGAGVFINEKHAIDLDKSLNSKWWLLDYKYYFF